MIAKLPAEHQRGMYEYLKPYLKFQAAEWEPIADCPKCGFRRGSVTEHTCTAAA